MWLNRCIYFEKYSISQAKNLTVTISVQTLGHKMFMYLRDGCPENVLIRDVKQCLTLLYILGQSGVLISAISLSTRRMAPWD